MFSKGRSSRGPQSWLLPVIIGTVLAALIVIQILRVNAPQSAQAPKPVVTYTAKGPLIAETLAIPGDDYYVKRVDLNYGAKLTGEFRTPSVDTKVSIVVLNEANFLAWGAGSEFRTLARTGFVPGGRVNAALDAGANFLIIDNRQNKKATRVNANFAIE